MLAVAVRGAGAATGRLDRRGGSASCWWRLAGLSWIALIELGLAGARVSAVAGMRLPGVMASVLWCRYSYLLELSR
jgi:hypothetical protein